MEGNLSLAQDHSARLLTPTGARQPDPVPTPGSKAYSDPSNYDSRWTERDGKSQKKKKKKGIDLVVIMEG